MNRNKAKEQVLEKRVPENQPGQKLLNENKFLTLLEASEFLNLKVSRLRYEVFKKAVPFFKIGRSIRFSEKDLISWVMNQKQEPRGV